MKYLAVTAITMDEEGPHFIIQPSFVNSEQEKIEFATKLMTQTLMGNTIPPTQLYGPIKSDLFEDKLVFYIPFKMIDPDSIDERFRNVGKAVVITLIVDKKYSSDILKKYDSISNELSHYFEGIDLFSQFEARFENFPTFANDIIERNILDLQIRDLINTDWVNSYLIVDDVGNKISSEGNNIYDIIKTTLISHFSVNMLTQENEEIGATSQKMPRFFGSIDCPNGFIFYFHSEFGVYYFFIENRDFYKMTKKSIVKQLRKHVKDIDNLLSESDIEFNFSSTIIKYITSIDLFILFTLDSHIVNIYASHEINSNLIDKYIENAVCLINSVNDVQRAHFTIEAKSKLIHIQQLDSIYAVMAVIREYDDPDETLDQITTFVTNLKIRLDTNTE